jgi:hypothetical protein
MAPLRLVFIQDTLAKKMSLLEDIDKKSESKGKLALKYGIPNSFLC